MNNIQINGQRRWGPPDDWCGPPPVHGTEIFIKNLPEEVFEKELYNIFSTIGMVYEVRLPINWNGFNRGYAFLRFTTIYEADVAIAKFDGFEIRKGRLIKVSRSVDNTRLFLSAVPIEKNADELKNDLCGYVDNVRKVYVYPTLENRAVFRGYAFVEFETHRDAAIAKRILTPDVCFGIFEKKCVAAWANPLPFLDRSILRTLNVLFMRNIPKEIKGFQLKKLLETLIGDEEIKRVKRLNDFAFLTFKDHESAERALCALQDVPFVIPDHETQIEWAIPREIADSSFSQTNAECDKPSISKKKSEKSSEIFPCDFDNLSPNEISCNQSFSDFGSKSHNFQEKNIKYSDLTSGNNFVPPLLKNVKPTEGSCFKTQRFTKKEEMLNTDNCPSNCSTDYYNVWNYLESTMSENCLNVVNNSESPQVKTYGGTSEKFYPDSIFTNKSLMSKTDGVFEENGSDFSAHISSFSSDSPEKVFLKNLYPFTFTKYSGKSDNFDYVPKIRNLSPDSSYGSRDSEDNILNVGRRNTLNYTSSYPSLSPTAFTNRSSGSSTQTFWSDDQDLLSPNATEEFLYVKDEQDFLSFNPSAVNKLEV